MGTLVKAALVGLLNSNTAQKDGLFNLPTCFGVAGGSVEILSEPRQMYQEVMVSTIK